MSESQETSLPPQAELARQEGFRPLVEAPPVEILTTASIREEIARRRELGVEQTKAAVLADRETVTGLITAAFPDYSPKAINQVVEAIATAPAAAKPAPLHQTRPELRRGPQRTRHNRDIAAMTFGQAEFAVFDREELDPQVLAALTKLAQPNRLILPQVGVLTYEATVRRLERQSDQVELGSTIAQGVYLSVGSVTHRSGKEFLNVKVGGGNPVRVWHPEAYETLALNQQEIDAHSALAARLQGLAMTRPYVGGIPGIGKHHR